MGEAEAQAASDAALVLEVMGRDRILTGAGAAVLQLGREREDLERELARMCGACESEQN